jgi:DNA-binding LacI/PurR family transcriptional regulator
MKDQGRVRNITDLARLAGVSPGTVSRALADSQLIARKTRERIQQLAREHDFRPNVMARNLRTRRAGAIGVLMPLEQGNGDSSDIPSTDLLGHLADALTGRGYDLLLSRIIPNDPESLNRVVDSGRVDGVIVIAPSDQLATIDHIASRYRPMVAWSANGQVRQDAATVATDLVDLLFRRIAGEETGSAVLEPELLVL